MLNEKKTAAIAIARQTFGSREFTAAEWDGALIRCELADAIREGAVRKVFHTMREYFTLQEVVDELNSCSGEDCEYRFWFLKVDDAGRAYQEYDDITYQLVEE